MLTKARDLRLLRWDEIRARLHLSEQHRRFLVRAILIAIAVRIALLIAGYVTGYVILHMDGASARDVIRDTWDRWDANNYERVAEVGYRSFGEERLYIVFFPLYPGAMRAAHYIFGSFFVSGLFVSAVAAVAAGFFMQVLIAQDGGDDGESERSLWYMSLFPTAYFLAMPYTEALFMALALASFVAARGGRWAWSGGAGMLACVTRMQGLALAPALAVEAFHQHKLGAPKKAFWLALIPVGFLTYLAINLIVYGNAFEFLTIQREHWYHDTVWPWQTIRETIDWIRASDPGWTRMSIYEFRAAAIVLASGLLIGGARMLRPSYHVFAWASMWMFLSVSFEISLPRYILCIFPLFIVLAKISASPGVHQVLLTMSAVLFGALFIMYATNWGF